VQHTTVDPRAWHPLLGHALERLELAATQVGADALGDRRGALPVGEDLRQGRSEDLIGDAAGELIQGLIRSRGQGPQPPLQAGVGRDDRIEGLDQEHDDETEHAEFDMIDSFPVVEIRSGRCGHREGGASRPADTSFFGKPASAVLISLVARH